MEVKKNTIDSYEVITDDDGRIIKLILKCGNLTEEYPIRYDKNGNVMRIGAEWMSFLGYTELDNDNDDGGSGGNGDGNDSGNTGNDERQKQDDLKEVAHCIFLIQIIRKQQRQCQAHKKSHQIGNDGICKRLRQIIRFFKFLKYSNKILPEFIKANENKAATLKVKFLKGQCKGVNIHADIKDQKL